MVVGVFTNFGQTHLFATPPFLLFTYSLYLEHIVSWNGRWFKTWFSHNVSVSWTSIVAASVPIFVDSTIQQSHFSDGELMSKSHIFLDWNTFFHDISIFAMSNSRRHGQVATHVQVAGGLAQGALIKLITGRSLVVSINGGNPSSHPLKYRIFHCKPSSWGYHHLWKPPYVHFITGITKHYGYILVHFLFYKRWKNCSVAGSER